MLALLPLGMTLAAVKPGLAVPAVGATRYLDLGAPPLRRVVDRVVAGLATDRDRAVVLHDWVRDRIPFGFAAGFWDQRASTVLRVGRGYCNTKSTLFTALLRIAGIPARQVFVDIDAAVLHGLVDPGTPFVDHSYVEVWIEGAWRATDSYIVDKPLFQAARQRAGTEGRRFGYGVHATGTCDWDGLSPAFSQYNLNQAGGIDAAPLGTRVWGVFEDVGAFYDQAEGTWSRLNGLARAGFGLLAGGANGRAEDLRRGL
jgi:hypothetical protein